MNSKATKLDTIIIIATEDKVTIVLGGLNLLYKYIENYGLHKINFYRIVSYEGSNVWKLFEKQDCFYGFTREFCILENAGF